MKIIISKTKDFVKERLMNEKSGHDYWHTMRVYNNAIDIAKEEQKENKLDMMAVELGSLLHDIADHKFGYDDEDRKEIIGKFLTKLDVDSQTIDNVIHIANNISFKNKDKKNTINTLEGKIVQDADRLDAIGAIGIARTFTFGGFYKRDMYNPTDEDDNEHTIAHFYDKLLLLKDRMNTKTGKQKALKRHEYMNEFLDQFYDEWEGKR